MTAYGRRAMTGGALLLALLLAACHFNVDFALCALEGCSKPATAALHRLTAPLPFPLAEPLALLLADGAALGLLRAARLSLRSGWTPLKRWAAGTARAALLLLWALALLWAPARALPVEAMPAPDGAQLEGLCEALIDALNGSALEFPPVRESLRRAPRIAGTGLSVKAVRYPEWMDAARVSGLFVPLTGEALADAEAPGALAPFTAVHELMHLAGIADEGAANIAAWQRCMQAGGAFADSARLWALRYALGMLGQRDPEARLRAYGKMKDELARVLWECNGDLSCAPRRPDSFLSPTRGDYAALAGFLISEAKAL